MDSRTAAPHTAAHPVVRIAQAHLAGASAVRMAPMVPAADFHEVAARFGAGPDHAAGETPIAFVRSTVDSSARARGYGGGYVVTDRRIFGQIHYSNTPRMFSNVPYAHLGPLPPRPGALAQSFTVPVGPQQHKLYIAPRPLHAFLAAIAALPPAYRTFGPAAAPPSTPQDPTGARAAAATVGNPDPRTWVPLCTLFELHRRGVHGVDVASGLVGPMLLLARSVTYGRSADQLGWHSVLPRPALAAALRTMLGEPVGGSPDGAVLDFRIGAGSGAGAAVASTVVGVAAMALTGFGWVSTSTGQRLDVLRATTHDRPGDGGSAFHLLGTSGGQWEPLYMHWWRAGDTISQALFRLEARYLLGRALYGPDLAPDALLSIPRRIFEDTVTPLVGPVDLDPFLPG